MTSPRPISHRRPVSYELFKSVICVQAKRIKNSRTHTHTSIQLTNHKLVLLNDAFCSRCVVDVQVCCIRTCVICVEYGGEKCIQLYTCTYKLRRMHVRSFLSYVCVQNNIEVVVGLPPVYRGRTHSTPSHIIHAYRHKLIL